MPNWCENDLVIRGNATRVREFFNKHIINESFDNNTIIPQPKTKEECSTEFLVNENSHIELDNEKDWFDWYKWNVKKWGVKWNNSNTMYSFTENDTTLSISFLSPWSTPYPVIKKLFELYPDLDIKFYYVEPGMCFGGYLDKDNDLYCGSMEELKMLWVYELKYMSEEEFHNMYEWDEEDEDEDEEE